MVHDTLVRCPFCGETQDRVIDSRQSRDCGEIRRRRECVGCDRRFTTYERVVEALPVVVKVDGRREPFDRNKIERGIHHAAAKLAITTAAIAELAAAVESEVAESGAKEIAAREIGEKVLLRLRAVSHVAYVRYASIYKEFRSIEEFSRELDELRAHDSAKAN